ncbi:MAG TPA: hypothetical protein VK524_12090 [Polyangiaceae bacterium]|nr:hypothetical protein [Polyangiaceae bacterium]
MTQTKRPINVCTYKVKPGKEAEMERLLAVHWPALQRAGLVTDEKPRIYRGLPSGKPGDHHGASSTYIEMFSWKDDKGPELAHQSPIVMAVWEPMGAICEHMDFPSFEAIELPAPSDE